MRISVVWSMLRYIASSKINNKPLTDTKYDFSNIVEKMENWIGRTVHGPPLHVHEEMKKKALETMSMQENENQRYQ